MSDDENWQLDGSAAELYERYLVPTITSVWAADLVDRAKPVPGARVLDVACGTGVVARLVADRVPKAQVVGLDSNPGMLAVARSVTSQIASLKWLEGSATCLPLARLHSISSFANSVCNFLSTGEAHFVKCGAYWRQGAGWH